METMNRSAPTYQSIYSDGKKKEKEKTKGNGILNKNRWRQRLEK